MLLGSRLVRHDLVSAVDDVCDTDGHVHHQYQPDALLFPEIPETRHPSRYHITFSSVVQRFRG